MEMLGIEFATPVGKAASDAIKSVAADGNAECTVRRHAQTPLAPTRPFARVPACASSGRRVTALGGSTNPEGVGVTGGQRAAGAW